MMNFNRKFEQTIDGQQVLFDVTYDPATHHFNVLEEGKEIGYLLKYDMATRVWSTEGEGQPSLPAEELATLVQKSFGHFV